MLEDASDHSIQMTACVMARVRTRRADAVKLGTWEASFGQVGRSTGAMMQLKRAVDSHTMASLPANA